MPSRMGFSLRMMSRQETLAKASGNRCDSYIAPSTCAMSALRPCNTTCTARCTPPHSQKQGREANNVYAPHLSSPNSCSADRVWVGSPVCDGRRFAWAPWTQSICRLG
jgi:hypothetical protein